MKLQDRLKIIGQALTGKQQDPVEVIREVIKKDKFVDFSSGLLDLSYRKLSDYKSVSDKLLKANEGWVYRNNDVIAQEVSKIDFELYRLGFKDGEIVYNEIKSHPLLDLLDHPNEETSKNDAIYVIQSQKKLTGNAYWLKIRKNGQVVALRELPPDKITLNLRQPTETDPTVIESFQYKDDIDGHRINITYQPDDIIHFKKPNPDNPFIGIGAVEALKQVIDLDNLTNQTQMNYFLNGAIQNFALTTDAKITDEQLKRLKAEMRASLSGIKNSFNVPIFGGGLKPTDISYSNKEMQFLDQLEWYRDKIMVGFGNTKASLGIIDDVNRASHESSINAWLNSTIKPDMEAIVNTLNEYLVPEFGENLILGFANPVPEDRSDDIEEATKLYAGNIIKRSEARELLEYDNEPSDEVYYSNVSTVLTPDGTMPEDDTTEQPAPAEDNEDEE